MNDNKHLTAKTVLEEILEFIRIKPDITSTEGEENTLDIHVQGDNLNFLIGYKGESLEGLQTILNLILAKRFEGFSHVTVDINYYRQQRREKIEDMTKGFIDKVRFFRGPVHLPPMNAFERKCVHLFVDQYDDVVSESEGFGKDRHVVLRLKD